MKKTLQKSIKQNLKIYTTDEGLFIVQGSSYNRMLLGFFFAMFAMLMFMGSFQAGSYVFIGFSIVLCLIATFLFALRKIIYLNSTKHMLHVKFIFLGLPIFKFREHSFSNSLLNIYDSKITPHHESSSDTSSICKLQIMTTKGFEDVFTFNSTETAYGFRKAILQIDQEFSFETSAIQK